MKKFLLLILCAFSLPAFSQASATQPVDLYQCGNEVFNLTVQTPAILGSQQPPQFTVTYFLSQTDADANANAIANPTAYVSPAFATIYARVDNTSDATYATTSFNVSWEVPFQVADIPDVTACESYTLVPVFGVSYSMDAAGTVPAPSIINISSTIYRHLDDFPCSIPSSFNVTINPAPIVWEQPDIVVCDSWITPALPAGMMYYTGPGGTGSMIPPGIGITTTQTIYILAESGTTPNCTSESSFTVTVLTTPWVNVGDVTVCDLYVLPSLEVGSYYTGPMGTGVQLFPGDVIDMTMTLYVFATSQGVCFVDQPFQVIVVGPIGGLIESYTQCDPEQDGFESFDLNHIAESLANEQVDVVFYGSELDAQLGVNALSSPFTNTDANSQTIWYSVHYFNEIGCTYFYSLELQTGVCGAMISGVVRADDDGDGCDASDAPLSNIQVAALSNNTWSYAYTNSDGEYLFTDLTSGNYTVHVTGAAQGSITPSTANVTITAAQNYTADFCATPTLPVNDVITHFWQLGNARPGLPVSYLLTVYNDGNTLQNGTLTLVYDDFKLNFTSANPAATSTSEGQLQFVFDNLAPGELRSYTITYIVEAPPTVNIGMNLNFVATAEIAVEDATPLNNIAGFSQTVVNSFDPNDKIVQRETMFHDDTEAYLEYVVRFQNTGTAEAIDVKITDQLDENLDWDTFRPVSGSHDFMTTRNDSGMVTFTFNDINLPDSTTNEPASHGFVTYAVKLKSGLTVNDDIYNTANIYFDFNPPIVTNTVMTDLVGLLGVGEQQADLFVVYPNPASSAVIIAAQGEFTAELIDIHGKKVIELAGADNLQVDISRLQAGMYFVKVTNAAASEVKKLMVR